MRSRRAWWGAGGSKMLVVAAALTGCDKGSGGGGQFVKGPAPVAPPEASPIQATFTQATFSTAYSVNVSNADSDHVELAWSGPNCGTSGPTSPTTCDTTTCTATFSWSHPHPPCSPTTDHKDVTIVFTATGTRSGGGILCQYQGADTGTGPRCVATGFDDSTVGPDSNAAHIVYQLPAKTACSKVDLIQTFYVVAKDGKSTVAVPHNAGMIDPGGNPLGYQIPAEADDVNGHVVDKFQNTLSTNDPYYAGSTPGAPLSEAVLDDKPGNTKPGYISIFEVCAFCSAKAGDAAFGQYLDCFSWQLDGDTQKASKVTAQPAQKPTAAFNDAVNKWNGNHGFVMPK